MAGAGGQWPDVGDTVPELPGYRIERQLGRGSMGVVYLAEDVQLRRKVALKILAPTLADDDLFRRRFDRESQSAANLDHPNIVPVYAAGQAGGLLYIAMRYVGGGDLRTLLEAGGPLSLEQTTSIVAAVADALDAAHAQGMIHRDVKPANVLIDGRNGQEHYYLSDFGITKIVSSGRSLTSTGQIVGTIDYIAPEQIQGKPVDGRTDLYALGCVLYQCLTGMVPFPREEAAALMWAHVHDEPPPVTTRRPDLPPQIDRIVARAMAKQPEDRYATCRELALALRAVAADPAASDHSGRSFPTPPVDSPPPPPASAGMTSTYTPPTPTPVRAPVTRAPPGRRWWLLAACGVLTLAVIAGSTAAVLNYLGSRFPNEAEQALLGYVPLALTSEDSCTRNADAERRTANVQASVACASDEDANTIVFTKFTSAKALDQRYQAAVAAAGIGQSSGDCLSAERAEGAYASESGRTSGRVLCYQQRGSSFITWTDEQSQTLGSATRVDPDYAKLRGWWAGVVGLKLPTPEPIQASPPPPPPPAARVAPPAPAPTPRPEPAPAPPPEPGPDPAGSAGQAQDGRNQGENSGEQDEDSGEQGEDQPTETPTTPPSSSTTPPTSNTPPPPPTPPVALEGPAPAAPRAQQGGPPVPGTGGCTAIDKTSGRTKISNYYACTVTQAAPAYLPGTTEPRGHLPARQTPFLCQSKGSKYSVGNRANDWWAWVGLGDAGVWAPTVFLAGGPDDAPVPGLPVCGSTPTTTEAPPTTSTEDTPTTTEAPPTTDTDNSTTERWPSYPR
ncbi:MAG: serine/threonine-protein kinase [Pseudonocardiaceae bacterium]